MSQLLNDLHATRIILERHGWCKRHYHNEETGGYCIMGAIETALENVSSLEEQMDRKSEFRKAVYEAIDNSLLYRQGIDLTHWNDTRREVSEIYQVLDRAIHKEESLCQVHTL